MVPERVHIRHCLLLLYHLKKSTTEAKQLISEAYGDNTVSIETCQRWFSRFRNEDFDLDDKNSSGRQARRMETRGLRVLLREDPAQSTHNLAKQLRVDRQIVLDRLDKLDYINMEGKWIPRELSECAILDRYNICLSLLCRHKRKNFLSRIVTGDEKWIYLNNLDRKQQSEDDSDQVVSRTPIRYNIRKVLLCVWWDQQGVIYYELLPSHQTVTAEIYSKQLKCLEMALLEKRPSYITNELEVIYLYNNDRSRIAAITTSILIDLGWEILPHPAYSPDITPSDYHLFLSMQRNLKNQRFQSMIEVQKWVDNFFASQEPTFYKHGIQFLPERWQKVVNSNGTYFN